MSASGGREVAHRVLAAEYDDTSLEYRESDEERAPNYVITPTGATINRLFVVGVCTTIEQVNEDTLRARVVDPTGAFVVYAGQYEPEQVSQLETLSTPEFVAVTGKANAFSPDGSDDVLTSIRPESINVVDAATRDRWVLTAAEHSLSRIEAMATAQTHDVGGDDLVYALEEEGMPTGTAAMIVRALDHYATTPAYLDELREVCLDAVEVVADERVEVRDLSVTPADAGPGVDPQTLTEITPAATSTPIETASPDVESTTADDGNRENVAAEEDSSDGQAAKSATDTPAGAEANETTEVKETTEKQAGQEEQPVQGEQAGQEEQTTAETQETSEETEGEPAEATASAPEGAPEADSGAGNGDMSGEDVEEMAESTDEIYEFDEEEREAVVEEHGLEFSSGADVESPDEADEEEPAGAGEMEPEPAESSGETGKPTPAVETEADDGEAASDAGQAASTGEEKPQMSEEEGETAAETTEVDETEAAATATAGGESADPDDVDVESVLLTKMDTLDDGDGADRSELISSVAADTGVTEAAVEDAIDEALMAGRCYEPGDGKVKRI